MDVNVENGAHLKLEQLGKSFGAHTVLRGLHLEVEPGEFIAIIGRSGCGKSTLLRLIAGLDTPSEGRILLDGQPLQGLNRLARVMFQDSRLLPWKRVIDNVALGLKGDSQEKALRALQQVGLADRAGEWPSVLSGGQRQRVALARALACEPRLLLLDEPLGALDALTRMEMHRLIERLWLDRKFTAFLITHDVEEAVTLADRVILIENGRCTMDLPIHLSRPRQRGQVAFAEIVDKVLKRVIGEEERKPILFLENHAG
jgi:sulfonate transport system ATP-binding protein